MKKLTTLLFVLTLVLGFSLQTQAELFNRGTDSLGSRLIYDSDLDVTWYDYRSQEKMTWQYQNTWAEALIVTFGSVTFTDWRLPETAGGQYYTYGFDGTTTAGYNIESSEMGHLYYTELRNISPFTLDGIPQSGSGLINKGTFLSLQPALYWSGTELTIAENAWNFQFNRGYQDSYITYDDRHLGYALAVLPGDIAAAPPIVPEPISSILFITGGATLLGRRYIGRGNIGVANAKEKKG